MLDFLYIAVSWVLLRWHQLWDAVGVSVNWSWALSVVFLVITARLLLFRLFVKQVHYQRNMQRIQPQIQALRKKYKDDRAALNREMMALQQKEGFNPLAGCLPLVLQIPVFIGLYHVLRHLSNSVNLCAPTGSGNSKLLSLYTFSKGETCQAAQAKIFNAPLAASFHDKSSDLIKLGGDPSSTRVVLVIMLIISAGATFGTQLLVRNNQTTTPEGTAATVQKFMLYVIPVGTLASGLLFNFPLGVLLYWFTSNLWTLGQQAYIIKFHPATDAAAGSAKPTGELGKTLAPRPGQRPVRTTKTTTTPDVAADRASDGASDVSDDGHASTAGSASTDPPANGRARSGSGSGTAKGATAVPRPGQRPTRPNGKRPPAKRSTQTKKRR